MNTGILLAPIKQTEQYRSMLSRLSELRANGQSLPLLVNGLCDGAEYALIHSLCCDLREQYKKTILIIVAEERRANRLNDF